MVNHYFQGGKGMGATSEQDLLQDCVDEVIQMVGMDLVYIPRQLVNVDEVFQEDTLSKFTQSYVIEMYAENYDSYFGLGPQINNFGWQLNYQLRLVCSRRRFQEVMSFTYPGEGDLIFNPVTKGLFEIKQIEDKKPFYPLGSRQYFVMSCELFKYSDENIATGTDADQVASKFANNGTTIKDPFGKNSQIDTIAAGILDISESDPFSGH